VVQLYFLTLTIAVALAWVAAFWKSTPGRATIPVVAMIFWLSLTGAIAASGTLQHFDSTPPPIGVLIIGAFVLNTALAWSPYGTRLRDSVPIQFIVGFQVFRLGVEIFLWAGARTHLVPPQMTFEGRNWDVITGLTALPVAWLYARGSIGKTAVAIWNVLGFGLLLNVMIVAIFSLPTPLQQFEPANRFVATPPYIWLPTVLVQAAWFSHMILFRQLSKRNAVSSIGL
jgi:hypothetical protein